MLKIHIFFISLVSAIGLYAQTSYFADGYHGGTYGHYPLWQTQFMIDKLNENPDWKINLEIEPETWDSVQLHTPEAYRQWQNIADNPRIEWTNPTYAQPYCFNISGESIIRQFEYGIRKIKQHFPKVSFYTYAVEEPCFTSALPQILRSFGFHAAVLKNPNTCWGGYVAGFGNGIIHWTGPDGTSLLTVPRYACEALEKNSTWQTTSWNNSDEFLQTCSAAHVRYPVGMCYQDVGWKNGPWLGSGEHIKNNSRYVTWREYFTSIDKENITDEWHLSQEDIRVSLMWGSQVLQRIAQEVRHSENKIVQAEKIASMARIERNEQLPDAKLAEAWRTLLLSQHHDSWIVPYNHLRANGRTWAEEIALWTANTDSIAGQIIRHATMSSTTAKKNEAVCYLKMYNTLPVSRHAVISEVLPENMQSKTIVPVNVKGEILPSSMQIKAGKKYLTFSVVLPAFGYTTVRLKEKSSAAKPVDRGIRFLSKQECVMENDRYRITFDLAHGGIIKSLIAKQLNNKEFVDNQSAFGFGELRGRFYEKERFISNREQPAQLSIVENNDLRKQVCIESQIDEHPCRTYVTLNQSSDIIDFSLQIDWKNNTGIGEYRQTSDWRANRRAFYDDRFKLNLLLPARLNHPALYKDAPFDVCKSQPENTFYNTWDSIKNNIILRWVDLLQNDQQYGLALFSDHTASYSYGRDFPLGLTLQYSGIGLWGVDYTITQPLHVNYALLPHRKIWNVAGIGTKNTEWNEPPIVVALDNSEMTEQSFLRFDRSGYELSACKPDGDQALILRVFNRESDSQPVKITFNFPVKSCMEIALDGEMQSVCSVENNSIQVSAPRFGIKTFYIRK